MFEIDDVFLQNIGYDVEKLTEEKKDEYKQQLTEELQERLNERLGRELEPHQVDDLTGIQNSAERAESWLIEFHPDYASSEAYRDIVEATSEDEAKVFYASMLWMHDAIPGFGVIISEELHNYQDELIKMRQMADDSLAS